MEKQIFYNNGILNKNKLKESWVKKNYNDEYERICIFGKNIKFDKFSQLLYHYVYNIKDNLRCKHCNSVNSNFLGFDMGYTNGCSRSCNIQLTRPNSNKTRRLNTIRNHGVYHTSQLDSVKAKTEKTNIERYGVSAPAQNSNIMNKIRNTNLERYGVELPMQLSIIVDKHKQTCIDKYSVDNYSKTDEFKQSIKKDGEYHITTKKVRDKIKKTTDDKNFLHFSSIYNINGYRIISYELNRLTFHCNECNDTFIIGTNLAHQRVFKNKIDLCLIHNPLNSKVSNSEREITRFIESIGILNIQTSNRKVLSPFEVDIYLPDQKIGFELNGLYWHSEYYKDDNYHQMKYLLAKEAGITLLQIWEDDWLNKSEIIKSRIYHALSLSSKIFARNCEVKIVNSEESREFLNSNHAQGWCVSKYRYGLYLNNELISIMTFGKNRVNLNNSNNGYELLRFCNRVGYSVVGGSSRLLKRFIREVEPLVITSWCTNDWSLNNFYTRIGFVFEKISGPNYFWCSNNTNMRENRWNFRKDKLVKDGYDPNMTEVEIMHSLGYYRCFDSGNTLYKMVL